MKRLSYILLLFILLFISTPVSAQDDERILNFESEIVVNRDNSIDIVETIIFNPSTTIPRHGLEWRIPYIYSNKAFQRTTKLDINSVVYYPVSNEKEKVFNKYSRVDESGWATLRIGDADLYIDSPHVYVIDYTLKYSGISFFDEYEEVYLNIIGPGWAVPIKKASAIIKTPEAIKEILCFTGPDGSTNQNCNIEVYEKEVKLSPKSELNPYEGYTVAIKQPLGTFEDTRNEQRILFILSNIGIVLPIPVGFFLLGLYKSRYARKKLTVIPLYEPEKELDALSSGTLLRSMFMSKNISALLIEMAIKGYCKIKEYEKKKYEFVKTVSDYSHEPKHVRTVLDAIFAYGDTVPIKKLTTFNITSNQAYSESKRYLNDLKAISKGKEFLRGLLIVISIIGIILVFNVAPFFIVRAAIGWFIGILISAIFLLIFALKIDIRTDIGNELYHKLLGLKMYINTAEKERIKFHNDPKKYTEVFEALLPYAMIFGLEKQWAKQFEDIYTKQPDWYQGDFTTFNTIYFVNSLNTFNRGVTTQAAPSNYSSSGGYRSGGWSSGGSGFGGGGSSGGGGGGSGGGGW